MADNNMTKGYDKPNLPYSLEAEQAVLGAIIKDGGVFDEVIEILTDPRCFYNRTNTNTYATMLDMYCNGETIDFVTLLEKLKSKKIFDDSTGKTYLMDLAQNCPSVSNVVEYAKIVREKYILRCFINSMYDIICDASDGIIKSQNLISTVEQRIDDIRCDTTNALKPLKTILPREFDRLDAISSKHNDVLMPIPTGFSDLDRIISGLNRSDLILIAARPGMGKSSLALNIAKNVALDSKKTVAFFSLEMSESQLATRLLSSEALVGVSKLNSGHLSDEEWERLVEVGDVFDKCNLYLNSTSNLTVGLIKSKLRQLKNVDLIVVDYLQLMTSGRKVKNHAQESADIIRSLKRLAKELNIPVLCVSQLNRAPEERADHRPRMSDLDLSVPNSRERILYVDNADIVLLLYRDDYYEKLNDERIAQNIGECIVAKNSHGETASIKLAWEGEYRRFTSWE